MKKYRIINAVFFIVCLTMVMCAWGAEPLPVVPIVPELTVPPTSLVLWLKQNLSAILAIGLALSELMGSSPWFKGNGLVDSVTKSLKFLLQKQPTP